MFYDVNQGAQDALPLIESVRARRAPDGGPGFVTAYAVKSELDVPLSLALRVLARLVEMGRLRRDLRPSLDAETVRYYPL